MKEIEQYIKFFKQLNGQTPLEEYYKIFDEKVEFKDPFNHTYRIKHLYNNFYKLYTNLSIAKFIINHYSNEDNKLYVQWTFCYQLKNSKHIESFDGVSYVEFSDDHKVIKHIDYWDASSHTYEKIPVLGFILRWIKKQFKV